MVKATIRFLLLTDLIAFEKEADAISRYQKDYYNNMISGHMQESDIELAKKKFNAIVVEEQE